MKNFTRQWASDPKSQSRQQPIERITEHISHHDNSSDDVVEPDEEPNKGLLDRRLELEEYPESVNTALHTTFYTKGYLPCTCSGKGGTLCLSEEYISALRLDGLQYVFGDDGHRTAMLSIIHRIAPFADVCVARIAGEDGDLQRNPELTSSNLAKVLLRRMMVIKTVVSNAIFKALLHKSQNLLIIAVASNLGGSKHELFPASHQMVFSIRATNTTGRHEELNPSLPKRETNVFGTLGLDVPTSNRGRSPPRYINIHDDKKSWDKIRMFDGFEKLLYKLSTEPQARMRFISLDNHLRREDQEKFGTALNGALA
ncbi:hypothetical protein F4810DRAFT_722919 [Camillea tinctor]|nr:hypothetical protein F4810DRAFT_722919 [Camillea tinctor]